MGILFLLGCTKNPPIVSPTTPTLPIVSPASVTTGNIDKEAITDRQTYKNKTYGFSIQFPSTWTFQEEAYGAPVMFFTPLSSPEDLLQENIMISQEKISKEYTLDDLWKIKKDKQTFSGFVEVSNEHIQVNTMDAKKIVYKALQ